MFSSGTEKIVVENLYKIFGPNPEKVIALLKKGRNKDEIMEQTRHGVGVADVSFNVKEGGNSGNHGSFRKRKVHAGE